MLDDPKPPAPVYWTLVGDCIEQMRLLRDQSVHCVVTSPPYFGLRDYGVDGQIGLEDTPQAFVARLVDVFREVRRVLRDDGTCWVNLGDSYASGGRKSRDPCKSKIHPAYEGESYRVNLRPADPPGIKPKDLLGIPWRVAFALQDDGWYLRQDIIWHKPNPMPESVRDRCTKAHEYLFLLTKSPRYYWDAEAMKEPSVTNDTRRPYTSKGAKDMDGRAEWKSGQQRENADGATRNRRSVWTVTTKPFKGAHFATFPPDLIEPCIRAGSPTQCCAACGAGWVYGMVDSGIENVTFKGSTFDGGKTGARDGGDRTQTGARTVKVQGPERPGCDCGTAETVPGIVLDPFGGSGTTAGVALKHGRSAVLCELNPKYAALIPERVEKIINA